MARPARPRWHKTRKRWLACIGSFSRDGRRREVFAPPTIGRHDEASAWQWLAEEKQRRGLD